MITIYSIEGATYQPYKTPTQDIQDGAEGPFYINLMRWLALEVVDLLKGPVQVVVFYLIVLFI